MNPVNIAHFPSTFGVMRVKTLVEPRLLTPPDDSHPWLYAEVKLEYVGGRWVEREAVYHEPLKARTEASARKECQRVAERRQKEAARTLPTTCATPPASQEARSARERVLAGTKWGPVVAAIAAGDEATAERLYRNITAALFAAPTPDDAHEVVRFRALFAERKKTHAWQLLTVAHWDALKDMRHGEIDQWLTRHGEPPTSPKALSRFLQRLREGQG